MKRYDFEQVEHFIIENSDELSRVSMGIEEDWCWTSDEVWNKEEGFKYYFPRLKEIRNIDGSAWGTPIMRCEFLDGRDIKIPCYYGESDYNEPDLLTSIICQYMGIPTGDK